MFLTSRKFVYKLYTKAMFILTAKSFQYQFYQTFKRFNIIVQLHNPNEYSC